MYLIRVLHRVSGLQNLPVPIPIIKVESNVSVVVLFEIERGGSQLTV